MSETMTIATGAPKRGHDDEAVGYFYSLPITGTPPADATTAPTGTPIDGGFVGEDGPTLTAEIDADMLRDWNLDQVLQLKTGTTATLEIPVFGWGEEQAKVIYGEDSVITTPNGFRVAWAGELAERKFFVLELRGVNGNGRLIVDGQIQSPGTTQFQTSDALRHSVMISLFKNSAFKDKKGRNAYFNWFDESDPVTP